MTEGLRIRVLQAASEGGAEWVLVSGEDAVCWLTGIESPIETGPSPFRGGPPLALFATAADPPAVVITNLDAPPPGADARVFSYAGISAADPEDYVANYLRALHAAMDAVAPMGAVGVDLRSLPAVVASVLAERSHAIVDVRARLDRVRTIKEPHEIALLRRSALVASIAQRAAVRAADAGMTELALFGALRQDAEQEAGARLPFAGDVVSGVQRTADIGGWPTSRVLQGDDVVITDLAPRVGGYWADSCNTFTLSRPSDGLRRMHDSVADALRRGIGAAMPGTPVSVIDTVVRERLARDGLGYPHHTGHGIGASVHEWPRIIPGEHAELRAGMVILIEPGAYLPDVGGVRLEHMFLITDRGAEQLTDFPQDLWPTVGVHGSERHERMPRP